MRKATEYKKEIETIKKDIERLLFTLKLSFSVEDILYADSITQKDLNVLDAKKEYRIFLNQSFSITENEPPFKTIIKKTRQNLLYLSSKKIEKLEEKKLYELMYNYTKLTNLFRRFKLLVEEIDINIKLTYTEIEAHKNLSYVYGIEKQMNTINELTDKDYLELIDLQRNITESIRLYKVK